MATAASRARMRVTPRKHQFLWSVEKAHDLGYCLFALKRGIRSNKKIAEDLFSDNFNFTKFRHCEKKVTGFQLSNIRP